VFDRRVFHRLMLDFRIKLSTEQRAGIGLMMWMWVSLKSERTARKTYRTRDQAKADVFDYVECFYT
jgi:putative transposase